MGSIQEMLDTWTLEDLTDAWLVLEMNDELDQQEAEQKPPPSGEC